jgi:hypothetical protein
MEIGKEREGKRERERERERERKKERERERERDVVSVLIVAAGVHLVEGNNHRCHSKGEGRKGMLLGLSISIPPALPAPGQSRLPGWQPQPGQYQWRYPRGTER